MSPYARTVYEREVRWHGLLLGAVRAWLLVKAEERSWKRTCVPTESQPVRPSKEKTP